MRRDWLKLLALLVPVLTGCLSHTHTLQQPKLAGVVLDAEAPQLVEAVNLRFEQVTSLSATVDFAASVGGAHKGKQTDYTSIHGYIRMRKPEMLRVLGYLPVVRLRAFDLASDGKTFTLLIPPSRAIQGSNSVSTPAANPMENLRPNIFLDSILIHSISPDTIVSLTNSSQIKLDTEDQTTDRAATVRPDRTESRGAKVIPRATSAGHPAASHPLQPGEPAAHRAGHLQRCRRPGDPGGLRAIPGLQWDPIPGHRDHQSIAGRIPHHAHGGETHFESTASGRPVRIEGAGRLQGAEVALAGCGRKWEEAS